MANAIAAWFGATATFLAVLVALFGPTWDRHRRRPRLLMSSAAPAELGTTVKVVGGRADDGSVIYWLRLPVSNVGRTTADDVRVIMLRIDAPQALVKQPPSRELKWADVSTDKGTLPPGVSRLVDLVHLTEAVDASGSTRHGVVSGVMPLSSADNGRPDSLLWRDMTAGPYSVHVSVSARDVTARHYTIHFGINTALEFDAVQEALRGAEVELVSRS